VEREDDEPKYVAGLAAEAREGLATTVVDAVPDVRYHYPGPGIWPFVAAVAVSSWLIWSVFSVKGFVWGLVPPTIAFIAWFWPRKKDNDEEPRAGEGAMTRRRESTPASVPAQVRGDALDVSGCPATASATAASCGGAPPG
jgi:hypothetical protein